MPDMVTLSPWAGNQLAALFASLQSRLASMVLYT